MEKPEPKRTVSFSKQAAIFSSALCMSKNCSYADRARKPDPSHDPIFQFARGKVRAALGSIC